MPRSAFEDLVRRHAKQKSDKPPVDWEERKNWWQGQMNALLDDIAGWLAPLIDDHTIAFTRQDVQRREETLGAYQIKSGLIKLGNETLSLNPVGSAIIGGFGRVDVKGPNGTVLFLLCAPDPDVPTERLRDSAKWFCAHPQQRTKLHPLTKESFEKIFSDLFGFYSS